MRLVIFTLVFAIGVGGNAQNTFFESDQVGWNWVTKRIILESVNDGFAGVVQLRQGATSSYKSVFYDRHGKKTTERSIVNPYSNLSYSYLNYLDNKSLISVGRGEGLNGVYGFTTLYDSIGKIQWMISDSIYFSKYKVLNDSIGFGRLHVTKKIGKINEGIYLAFQNLRSGKVFNLNIEANITKRKDSIKTVGFVTEKIVSNNNEIVIEMYDKKVNSTYIQIIDFTGKPLSQSEIFSFRIWDLGISSNSYSIGVNKFDGIGRHFEFTEKSFNHLDIHKIKINNGKYNHLMSSVFFNGNPILLIDSYDSTYQNEKGSVIWYNSNREKVRECSYSGKDLGVVIPLNVEVIADKGVFVNLDISKWNPYQFGFMKTNSSGFINKSSITSTCTDYRVGVQGIKPLNLSNQLKVYPNPTSNQVNIVSELLIKTLTLYSITGKEKLKLSPNKKQINLSLADFESGIYYVVVETELGVERVKVVKW